jgi:hypothetical protein
MRCNRHATVPPNAKAGSTPRRHRTRAYTHPGRCLTHANGNRCRVPHGLRLAVGTAINRHNISQAFPPRHRVLPATPWLDAASVVNGKDTINENATRVLDLSVLASCPAVREPNFRDQGFMHHRPPGRSITTLHNQYRWRAYPLYTHPGPDRTGRGEECSADGDGPGTLRVRSVASFRGGWRLGQAAPLVERAHPSPCLVAQDATRSAQASDANRRRIPNSQKTAQPLTPRPAIAPARFVLLQPGHSVVSLSSAGRWRQSGSPRQNRSLLGSASVRCLSRAMTEMLRRWLPPVCSRLSS